MEQWGGGVHWQYQTRWWTKQDERNLLYATEEDCRTQTKVKVLSSCEVHRGVPYFHFLSGQHIIDEGTENSIQVKPGRTGFEAGLEFVLNMF